MPGGRPRKPPDPPPRRKPGQWSVTFVLARNRWRVRPPPSVDPKRHETFHLTEEAAKAYVARQRARLAEPLQAVVWTLGEWGGQWLRDTAAASDWSPRTREIYAEYLWYFSPLHELPLDAIKPSQIRSRVAHLLTVGPDRRPDSKNTKPIHPLAVSNVAPALSTLTRCLEAARDDLLITTNPASRVTAPRVIRTKPTLWTVDEQAKLAPAIAADELEVAWRLLIDAGLRIGEVLGLTQDDVDADQRAVVVRRTVFRGGRIQEWPKSKQPRVVLMTPTTWSALRRYLSRLPTSSRWLFPPHGWKPGMPTAAAPRSYDSVRDRLRKLCATAGVSYHPTHTGRHWHATSLLAANVPAADVAERLGHADASITLRLYAGATTAGAQRALAAAALMLPGGFSDELSGELGTGLGTVAEESLPRLGGHDG